MPMVTSPDGTAIAYEHTGEGPAVVLVDGAMCHRGAGPMRPLAARLNERFTVYTYDRRGRGESGDTPPHAVAREVEDLRAVIARAGGRACVYGMSSGAALALATAVCEPGIVRLGLYEPPFLAEVDPDAPVAEYAELLGDLLAAGRRGDAVAAFMAHVGLPAQMIAGMRTQPGWAGMEAIAPTLAYDETVLGDGRVPRDVASRISVPTVVFAGDASPEVLQRAAKAAAEAIPAAELCTLEGQTHDVAPDALAPVLAEFFDGA